MFKFVLGGDCRGEEIVSNWISFESDRENATVPSSSELCELSDIQGKKQSLDLLFGNGFTMKFIDLQ